MKNTTLVYLIDKEHETLLLGFKNRGLGKDRWNGFGGKIEKGEGVQESALRELWEEAGVLGRAEDLVPVADLQFSFEVGPIWRNYVYFLYAWEGTPKKNTEFLRLKWFPVSKLPYERMWADDAVWLPKALAGEFVEGKFYFDQKGDHILEYSLEKKQFHEQVR
ncbi:MAG: 8-oxo-dGTP diphosphatase [Patescibacteria group bacterium]|nr:8-oxo-dGTP diphosphatase [Patescibacteria group bacterium]